MRLLTKCPKCAILQPEPKKEKGKKNEKTIRRNFKNTKKIRRALLTTRP